MTARFDDLDPLRRRIMSEIDQRATKPDMLVQSLLHTMNYRHRLHRKNLQQRPNIVFGTRRKAIFVHGWFWQPHPSCSNSTSPKTRARLRSQEFDRNVERDGQVERRLSAMGWKGRMLWECEARTLDVLSPKLPAFLEDSATGQTGNGIAA